MVDQMVVSVGPYTFHNSLHRGRSSLARSRGNDSPPQRTLRVDAPLQLASASARHVAGVACITVHCESRIGSIKRSGQCVSLYLAITTLTPLVRGSAGSALAM